MKNQKEIYEALLAGETLTNGKNEILLTEDGNLNYNREFCNPSAWSIKPKPLEFWINIYEDQDNHYPRSYLTEKSAVDAAVSSGYIKTIKVREVTE
jgi:hypothetical protein